MTEFPLGGWGTDADYAVIRETDGEISVIIADGSRIERNGKAIISLPRRSSGTYLKLPADRLSIDGRA